MAAGPGERQQEPDTGQAHGVQVDRRSQRSLRVRLLQQLGHKDPAQQKVVRLCWTVPDLPDLSHSSPTCLTPLVVSHSQKNFVAIVDLPEGEHQYKFCVDGQWTLDPTGVSERFRVYRPRVLS